jgi:hypothetical protein
MTSDRIVNFFHCESDNVGDQMSGPAQYIWPAFFQNVPIGQPILHRANVAIVGGGQIFSQLGITLASILELNPKAKVIAWGVGLPPKGMRDREVSQMGRAFSSFGTRNYDRREEFPFVPCASCLSPLFDRVAPPQHDFVVYLHRRKVGPIGIPIGTPTLTNAMRPPRDVIDFIASGDTVVTSSYHGVYWAQLLGRRVICVPYNNKFRTFQHPPTVAEPDKWLSALGTSSRTQPLLQEYRDLNRAYAVRALGKWHE